MKKTLLLFGLFFLAISCNKSEIYNQFDDGFDENRWQQKDVKTYEFDIEEDTKLYNIVFRFSHVYDYQFNSIPIQFIITDPSGETQQRTIDLQLKDASGKELSECSVDVCDLNYKLDEKIKLQKGHYKVVVSQAFQGPYLPNVLGVGLKVEDAAEIDTILGVKM